MHYEYEPEDLGSSLDARDALPRLNAALPEGRVVVTDVGRFVLAAWKYLSAPSPGQLIHTCTLNRIIVDQSPSIAARWQRAARSAAEVK